MGGLDAVGGRIPSMNADECNQRASECAANAALAKSEPVAQEFLRLAAQWRAMAGRLIYLGPLEELFGESDGPQVLTPLPIGAGPLV